MYKKEEKKNNKLQNIKKGIFYDQIVVSALWAIRSLVEMGWRVYAKCRKII